MTRYLARNPARPDAAPSLWRRLKQAALVLATGVLVASCSGSLSNMTGGEGVASEPAPSVPGTTIGTGNVKVALILPLSAGGQAGAAAVSLRNAAELAMSEFSQPDIQLLVKDDRGTPEGARAATQAAISEGAELILGPLFADAVRAAGQVARGAGRPVIAFSTDAGVAAPGVYLLSFMPESEVERVVAYAARQGLRSFAALIPNTAYGRVAQAAFQTAVARNGGRIVAMETYDRASAAAQAAKIAAVAGGTSPQVNAVFVPDSGDSLIAVAQALHGAGVDPQKVRMLGTGVWNEARIFSQPGLQGGWFAAPDAAGFNAFAQRYRAKYGSDPTRIATLGYDAVSLAAALVRTQGAQRFSEPVLTNASGFAGADGVFRFNPNGTNERGLAVLEIRNGTAVPVSPAPRQLGAGG
ncbi:penicillin-binding protein activator [Chelatococcus composti]|uniref:Outer membrane PBP1 activator LpoA protein n=1 Tax=Chelatococcus composti TaxID=1743235 RepID=A0A841K4B4_9HYPH|nr:penicillin-binding protein activator [Chelatococcus composti]MBB6167321.1 outer membrane PBP1 activator LpoA protein [Chelatococcus composti]MBS7735528.1 penicillin-binding protein activator [Chelatococcus composti]GGG30975.1 penicillin-binding protein activator [Chelatococcus composti]